MSDSPIVADLVNTAWSVLLAILPLVVIFMAFQIFILRLPRREVSRILTGTLIASLGLYLFLLGVNIGFLPVGRTIGEALGATRSPWLLVGGGMLLGFVTTWGEPAVRILANEVEKASIGSIPSSLVLYTICAGVAASVGVGVFRIAYGIPLLWLLVPGYAFVLAIMKWSDKGFISIAVDAGGVATGPLANTFLLALALGVASSIGEGNALVNGLGLVALIALAPVISLMALGLLVRFKERRGR